MISLSIEPSEIKVNPKHFQDIVKHYSFLKLRVRFLFWEVNIELLELLAISTVWITFTNFLYLFIFHKHSVIYDILFRSIPLTVCVFIAGSICLVHLAAILADDQIINRKNLICLKIRYICMFLTFIFCLGMTLFVILAETYSLSWQYLIRDSFAAWFSHIRLRKYYIQIRKKIENNELWQSKLKE